MPAPQRFNQGGFQKAQFVPSYYAADRQLSLGGPGASGLAAQGFTGSGYDDGGLRTARASSAQQLALAGGSGGVLLYGRQPAQQAFPGRPAFYDAESGLYWDGQRAYTYSLDSDLQMQQLNLLMQQNNLLMAQQQLNQQNQQQLFQLQLQSAADLQTARSGSQYQNLGGGGSGGLLPGGSQVYQLQLRRGGAVASASRDDLQTARPEFVASSYVNPTF